MTILEIDKIDIVATRPDTNIVKLVIADHLAWDDLESHCQHIQDKINTYIEFVESGQLGLVDEPKIPASPQIQIVLSLQHAPSSEGVAFLERVRTFLGELKLEFAWQTHLQD